MSRARTAAARLGALKGGVDGNRRLTALSGVVLLALLLVELATIPGLRGHVTVHMFVGLLLLPLALLKMAATFWRFSGYYLRREAYRAAGPPRPWPRLLSPLLVLTTVTLLISGVALTFESPSARNGALALHKASFAVWIWLLLLHLFFHLRSVPRLARGDLRRRPAPERTAETLVAGRPHRLALLGLSIAAGLVLAVGTLPFDHTWSHYFATHVFFDDHG